MTAKIFLKLIVGIKIQFRSRATPERVSKVGGLELDRGRQLTDFPFLQA